MKTPMLRRLGMAMLVVLLPSVSRADDAPERLLPASTQIYLRWDGINAHRAAYQQTALGKMAQGDTGKFVLNLLTQLQDNIDTILTVPQLLGGTPPERLQRIQADARQTPKLAKTIFHHGLVLAVEANSLPAPQLQATLILPNAGAQPEPFLGTMRLALLLSKIEIKEAKIGERTLHRAEAYGINLVWWVEGKDAVLVASTDPPEAILKRTTAGTPRLAENPLLKKVQAFKEFETSTRAFADVAAVVKIARGFRGEVGKMLDDLGLDSLQAITFHSGFAGPAERSVVLLDVPGPRKGLLSLITSKPFQLSDLPPLPPDVVNFSASRLDFAAAFDAGVKAVEAVVRLVDPNELPNIQKGLQQADAALGINLRQDLLGALGDMFVLYSSPAEGPLTFGQTFLFKVKDAKKLQASLDQTIKALAKLTGVDIRIKKKDYHGVDLYEVHVKQQGFFFIPSYSIYKDWLAVSYYPQAVQGYILRARGELPAWKPGPQVQAALKKLPQEFTSLSVSDPRPTVKQILSLAPLVAAGINSATDSSHVEVGSLPNAHEATRYLFPNVLVGSGDASTVRLETRTSLLLPLELSGLESYAFLVLAAFAFRFVLGLA